MEASEYVLGIDGGGSGTSCLLADCRGRLLGRGSDGPSNYLSVGPERALAAIDAAVNKAFQAAGLERQPAAVACCGLAGAGRPDDAQRLEMLLAPLELASHVIVTHDAAIALAGGLSDPNGPGIVIIAGTGSIAYGRSSDGETARAGGWGWLLGDEGSGYAIGRAALMAILAAHDGRRPATSLRDVVLAAWNLRSIEGIIGKVYISTNQRQEIAALAGLVLEQARAGDEVAQAILSQAAEELAVLALAVARRLKMGVAAPADLVLSGGMLLAGRDLLYPPLKQAIEDRMPLLQITDRQAEPVEGAVDIALASLRALAG